ncbi:MAG: hypothetical protein ACK528_02040 [Alphaproteobacteria bacterium]
MTRHQIAAKIAAATGTACEIELVKGDGYWYFTVSDVARNIWESKSECVMYLGSIPASRWIEWGVSFVNQVEADQAERIAV